MHVGKHSCAGGNHHCYRRAHWGRRVIVFNSTSILIFIKGNLIVHVCMHVLQFYAIVVKCNHIVYVCMYVCMYVCEWLYCLLYMYK